MEKVEILNTIKEIINNLLSKDTTISEETALYGEKILDSLEFMNYITYVEEKFNITIDDEDIDKYELGIIKNMVAYIYNLK